MNSVTLQAYNNGVTESVMGPAINFTEPFSYQNYFQNRFTKPVWCGNSVSLLSNTEISKPEIVTLNDYPFTIALWTIIVLFTAIYNY